MPRKSPTIEPRRCHRAGIILYAALIAVAVLFAAQYAFQLLARTPEFAQAGDFFGYLQMAHDFRAGAAPHHLPPCTFNSPHAHLLRDYLASQKLPLDSYNALLGPDAYHYQPRTGLIVNQYPPGIGWLLALFPQGSAYHIAAYVTLAALLGFTILVLTFAIVHGAKSPAASPAASLAAPAFAGLAAIIGLRMFGISVSYSIDLFALPMLLVFAAIHFAMNRDGRWAFVPFAPFFPPVPFALALCAGGFFGYAIACRLATVLFLPGFLILLWPGRFRVRRLAQPAGFLTGTFACGIFPLMRHQARVTGSPFASTYAPGDATAPSLAVLMPNLRYYAFGPGSLFILVLLLAAACFYFLFFRSARPMAVPPAIRRYAIAIPIFFVIPSLFFLTHAMTTDYYQLPTIVVCLFAMAFGVLGHAGDAAPRRPLWPAATIAGILLLAIAWQLVTLPNLPSAAAMRPPSLDLPPSLRNPNAWIFGDRYTGTLWYYHGIPAGMILPATPEARLKTYQFIFQRGDPLLFLDDNPALAPVLAELQQLGARFQNAGDFGREPVLQILWPPSGPKAR